MGAINSDGLFIRYGTDEATVSKGGETSNMGDRRELVFDVDATKLGSMAAVIPGGHNVFFPKGARIEEVELEVITALDSSGGTATLDVGLIKRDLSTELDYEAFVKAAAEATMDTAGKRLNIIAGSTAAGDLVGTTTTESGYITANYDTEAFTAGKFRVRVKYFFL